MLLALCLTVITSVGLGVATAYAAVIGILPHALELLAGKTDHK